MSERRFERALVLYQQSRPDLAIAELREGLAEDPENPFGLALLALCLVALEKQDEALHAAQQSVAADPELPFAQIALAHVLVAREEYKPALAAADEALRLDPSAIEAWRVKSSVQFHRRNWKEALAAAEKGLTIAPDDDTLLNFKALSLTQLGRKDEATAVSEGALSRDPDSPFAHSSAGWRALHSGDSRRALEHFRESLRLQPDRNDAARGGVIEALKARSPVYRMILRYFLFMGRLSGQAQWAILIGGYIVYRIALGGAEQYPILWGLVIAYVAFAALTIFASPLHNLALFIHPVGRHALDRHQKVGAALLGGTAAIAGISAIAGLLWIPDLIYPGRFFGLLCLPVAMTFQCGREKAFKIMCVVTGILALVTIGLSALFVFPIPVPRAALSTLVGLIQLQAWGSVLSIWGAQILYTALDGDR